MGVFLSFAENRILVWNVYGLTEATVVQTAALLTHDLVLHESSDEGHREACNNIGRPLHGINIGFLPLDFDENQNDLSSLSSSSSSPSSSVMLEGEICISGAQLGKGYLNSPELTASRFLRQSTLAAISHAPDIDITTTVSVHDDWLRTGDEGYWDGKHLFIRGRIDTQVKFRGKRLELGEIDTIVCQGTSVRLFAP